MMMLSVILIVGLYAAMVSLTIAVAFDYSDFESTHFPFHISVNLEQAGLTQMTTTGLPSPISTFKFTAGDYFESIDALCAAGHYSAAGCTDIMNLLRSRIFNPGGVVFDRHVHDYSSYNPVALQAERANSDFNCLEVSTSDEVEATSAFITIPGQDQNQGLGLGQKGHPGPGPGHGEVSLSVLQSPVKLSRSDPDQHALELAGLRALFSDLVPSELQSLRRVGFLHSCLPPGASTRILEELLDTAARSGMLGVLDALWILHYGAILPVATAGLVESYRGQFPRLHLRFVHRSTDIARFEVPTLRAVHYFSKLVQTLRERQQRYQQRQGSDIAGAGTHGAPPPPPLAVTTSILYLHTKGISYKAGAEPPQVGDWRRFMTYFVVEQHALCLSLLETSNVFSHTNFTRLVPRRLTGQIAGARRKNHRSHTDETLSASSGVVDPNPNPIVTDMDSNPNPISIEATSADSDSDSDSRPEPLRLDAIGVNVMATDELQLDYPGAIPTHFYEGNYWWARSSYLASLPQLSVHRNNKYDAETWIGASHGVLGSLHSSGIHHYDHRYPRERYHWQ